MRNNHVSVDAHRPQAQGICDRCGFRYQLDNLTWQMEWAGETLMNLHYRVCPTCLDQPNESLRTYSPGPDPIPARDPRPENVDMD